MRRLAFLALSTAALAGGRETAAVRLQPIISASAHPRVVFPQARFRLTARRPASAKAPSELSARARFAIVKLGTTTLTLTFDAPQATPALGLLYAGGKSARLAPATSCAGPAVNLRRVESS